MLPISADLRRHILGWVNRYYRYDGGAHDLDIWDFNSRSTHLDRGSQNELGSAYRVHYRFMFT